MELYVSQAALPPVLVVGLWQETNTYSPRRTTMEDFRNFELLRGSEITSSHAGSKSVVGGFLAHLGQRARPSLSASAWPAGPADRDVFDSLMTMLQREIAAAGPVGGVLLNLHGAMVADGYADVEATLTDFVRGEVGDIPIVAVVDFHANLSQRFTNQCDAIVAYRTYPHVDMFESGLSAAKILDEILIQGMRWSVSAVKLPLLSSPLAQGSTSLPVAQLLEEAAGIPVPLYAALTPGFPYSDVPRAGLTAAVSAPRNYSSAAISVANDLASSAWRLRETFRTLVQPPSVAVANCRDEPGLTVIADVGDNIGGGSPGDGTTLLEELLVQAIPKSQVTIWDPETASLANALGAGARIECDLGGRSDALHGSPVRFSGTVVSTSDGRYRASGDWMGGQEFDMGACAVLRSGSVTVLITTVATPPFHLEQLTSQGLDPRDFSVIVVKGALAWQDAFGDLPDRVFYADTPGCTPARPESLLRVSEFGEAASSPWYFPGQ